jgi:ribonuclease-3
MDRLDDLQSLLGVSFHSPDLLEQALTHPSFSNEEGAHSPSNGRLEFLGDAVLGLVVTERLYRAFPHLSEGSLTRLRSALVCQETLSRLGLKLGLGGYLRLGRGEEKSGGGARPSNLARGLEALIGAIYLDRGMETVRRFILGLMEEEIGEQCLRLPADYKSQLQELLHARKRPLPTYRTVDITGPDHERRFTVEVLDGERVLARGSGRSKRSAETEAARAALETLSAPDGQSEMDLQ